MKKKTNVLLFSGLAVIFVLMVVGVLAWFSVFDGEKHGHKNNVVEETESNDTVIETRRLNAFDAIENKGSCTIEFVQTDRSEVKIVASKKQMKHIKTKVRSGTLKISMDDECEENGIDTKLVIYSPKCTAIKNEGLAYITCDSLCTEMLKIENEGVGTIIINKLNVKSLKAENVGLGGITVSGVANYALLVCEGLGVIDATELDCKNIKIPNDNLYAVLTKKD